MINGIEKKNISVKELKKDGRYLNAALYTPKTEPGKTYPLVLFLHGAGERGDDLNLVLDFTPGADTFMTDAWQAEHPCFVLAPQCPENLFQQGAVREDVRNGSVCQDGAVFHHDAARAQIHDHVQIIPTPLSSFRSLPTIEICCMVSIPEPINVAPFTGFVTLPFSIRYASEVEKTNLPEVIST